MKVYHYRVLAARCCFILATERPEGNWRQKKAGRSPPLKMIMKVRFLWLGGSGSQHGFRKQVAGVWNLFDRLGDLGIVLGQDLKRGHRTKRGCRQLEPQLLLNKLPVLIQLW